MTRKTFIEGAAAFALTFCRRMFAAPIGWKHGGGRAIEFENVKSEM